ncbi:adhesion G protein-coupled receptor F5-like [Pelmatolapia mariae]|uniref:adhesion G protein-coupled receptor F5-like n=1 Tax=Pelmatolapia mariae TaxID=158779 RepID=UPI003211D5A9
MQFHYSGDCLRDLGCYPNSTGGLQCQCEDQFAWSCNKCAEYGACTPVDFDIDLELHIPVSSVPQNFSVVLRNILRNFSFPKIITGSLTLKDLNFTTWCYPNSTGGLQCQCEDQFAWSCNKCDEYGACSNVTSQTCDCIKGFPLSGEFCQPITTPVDFDIDLELHIPASSVPQNFSVVLRNILRNFSFPKIITGSLTLKDLNFTTWCYPNSTGGLQCQCEDQFAWSCNKCDEYGACSNVTSQTCDCIKGFPLSGEFCQPITTPVDFDIDLELHIPASSVPQNFSVVLRNILRNFSFPKIITGSLTLKDLNFTTWCYPNSTGGLQCQCEDQFAWSCDKCDEYGACSNVTSQTCDCIKGFPPDGEFCEPVTMPTITTTAMSTTTTTAMPTTTTTAMSTTTTTSTTAFVKTDKFDMTINVEFNPQICDDVTFGKAVSGFRARIPCANNEEGEKSALCNNRTYTDRQDTCILQPIKELLDQSEVLTATTLPAFLQQLSNVTNGNSNQVVNSPKNIDAVVQILRNVADRTELLNISINENSMKDILRTAGVLTTDQARDSWNILNKKDESISYNISKPDIVSSSLLQSLENITKHLASFNNSGIDTPLIILNRTIYTNPIIGDFNSSVEIEIPENEGKNKSITVITFASLNNVLPAREIDNSSIKVIGGRVVLVQSSGQINNISLTFDILIDTLRNPKCVFWNFSLLNNLGGWDDEGCEVVNSNETGTVTCNCNHLTSFSILMSPNSPDSPILDYITYIGVGISMGSLVICLIIEGLIWRKIRTNETSYLRHVSIVNIAVSLLIADIWFISGAAISHAKNHSACTAATFFIHFFYLALFFWMFASALLLLYRTTNVFGGGLSKASMLAIGFSLGYGAPLIIAIVTIAATVPDNKYIRENVICWLNWDESKALLAFVIPALSIVLINLIILVVVLYKIIRRRVGTTAAQAGERSVLLVIVKSLAVLTPFFGITWGLGAGLLADPKNMGINIAFAFFNSLQGFFILVFGTLLDGKTR